MTTWEMIRSATPMAFEKLLEVRRLLQNPTMAVVFFVNLLLTVFLVYEWVQGSRLVVFHLLTLCSLWLTTIFANFSEAVARGTWQGASGIPACVANGDFGKASHGCKR